MANDTTDWEAESLGGRVEALRQELNELVPGLGDLKADAFWASFNEQRDAVLAEFLKS